MTKAFKKNYEKKPKNPYKGVEIKKNKLRDFFLQEMAKCENMEKLNEAILIPFISALENITEARGYTVNIYGSKSNLVITHDDDSEKIYSLVETYLDSK